VKRTSGGPGRRAQRVAEQVRQAVTAFLQGEARDPRIGLVTVTGVDLSADLQRAFVRYLVHGGDEERSRTQEGLDAAAPAVRRRLGEALRLRVVPEVVFAADRGFEHAARIERLLAELRRHGGGGS
jgi:ribosome-binding factor A